MKVKVLISFGKKTVAFIFSIDVYAVVITVKCLERLQEMQARTFLSTAMILQTRKIPHSLIQNTSVYLLTHQA